MLCVVNWPAGVFNDLQQTRTVIVLNTCCETCRMNTDAEFGENLNMHAFATGYVLNNT